MSMLQGGRLTDLHKNNINTRELLTKLNKAAKEKINGRNMENFNKYNRAIK